MNKAKRLILWLGFWVVLLFLVLLLVVLPAEAQVTLLPVPTTQFLDANGDPLVSGKVFTYISGTTTNQASFTDSGGGTANANPVILDSAGRANIWLTDGLAYTIVLKTSADVQQWSVDGVISGDLETALVVGTTAVTFTSTPTFDSSTASYFSITLTGNVTSSTISNASDGRIIYFNICQDATGGRTFTWPTAVLNAATVSTAASSCTSASFIYDGSNWRELAPASRGSSVFDYVVDGNRYACTDVGIQAALDAANADGGGTVIVVCDSSVAAKLTIGDDTTLKIERGFTLTLTNGTDDHFIENKDTSGGNSGIRILGPGKLDGNRANQTGTIHGIAFQVCTDCQVIGLEITGIEKNAIDYTTGSNALVALNYLHGNGGSSISTDNTPQAVISNNISEGDGLDSTNACLTINGNRSVIEGNYIEGCTGDGIGLGENTGTTHCDYCTVTGNVVENAGTDGISLAEADWTTVVGNTIRSSGDDGISLLNSEDVGITGNIIDGTAGHGIVNTTGSGRTKITGNQISNVTGSSKDGIALGGGSGFTVIGNHINTVNLRGIRILYSGATDSDSVIAFNVIDGGTATDSGIVLDDAENVTIIGNRVFNFDRYGIEVFTVSTNNRIFGNHLDDNTLGLQLLTGNNAIRAPGGLNMAGATLTALVVNPLEGTLSNVPRWIFKLVDFGDMTAAATADTFTLWTLPANTEIRDVYATVVTGWSGGSISAAVCSVGTTGSANDLTLDDNFFTTGTRYDLHDATASGGKGTLLFDATDKFAPHMFVAGGVIEIQCDLTGDNHANATAGQARISILVSQPLGNTTTEAN